MKLSSETIEALFESHEPVDGWSYVCVQDGDHSRWHSHHTLVLVDPDGNTWGINFSKGLTENQDWEIPWEVSDPWNGDSNPIDLELTRLYPRIMTTVVYTEEEFGS